MSEKEIKDFKSWCAELTKIAPKYGWKCDPVKECGEESWKVYFENYYSPEDAIREDLTN